MSELSTEAKFVVIDGHSLLYRAFFGTRFLSTTDGRPTNALFGFVNMILNLLESERPQGILVAFDAPAKTFRQAKYVDYKAHRKEAPDDFKSQVPMAKEMVKSLGIPILELAGYEADDIIGTIAKLGRAKGYHVVIVTGDMDALQLVRDGVEVIATLRGVTDIHRYNTDGVIEKMTITPEQIPDYKALRGDPSDNIPGIAGVGEKTALKLLHQFGSIEQMLANTDQIADAKLRAKVETGCDICRQSKMLATIVTDVPLDYEPEPYLPTAETIAEAMRFMEDIEFKSVMRRLPGVLAKFGAQADPAVEVALEPLPVNVVNGGDLRPLMAALENARQMAIETTEHGIAISLDGETGYFAPFGLFPPEPIAKALANPEVLKMAHDAKGDYLTLLKNGMAPTGLGFDPMLAAYLLDPSRSGYPLETLLSDHLSAHLPPDGEPAERACYRAVGVFRLREPMLERLRALELETVYETIDLPVSPIVAEMEQRGVKVDADYLRSFSEQLSVQIEAVAAEVFGIAGHEFNIGSPKQLGDVLFGEMGLPGGKKTKTGAYTTNADLLQSLAIEHPIAERVMAWRELTKIRSTYAEALPKLIAEDGRIHTTFNLTVAATGRLSSTEPNLQNIPVRTELGREIRRGFVAEEGRLFLSIDYSQIELRLLAHMCRDEALLEAFARGQDVHTATAALLFNVPEDQVTKDQRRIAKTVNYAVLYGQSDFGLSQVLRIPVAESHAIIEQYFARFPKIKAFTEGVIDQARDKGYTTTLFGRRRFFPELASGNRMERLAAERAAVNAPIQGTAADVMKLAMIEVDRYLKGKQTRILLQVHDELLFETPTEEAERIAPEIGRLMAECCSLDVRLDVEARVGPNWRDLKPIEF